MIATKIVNINEEECAIILLQEMEESSVMEMV